MLDAANPILSSSTNLSLVDKLFFYHLDNLKPSLQPIKGIKKVIKPTFVVSVLECFPTTYILLNICYLWIQQCQLMSISQF